MGNRYYVVRRASGEFSIIDDRNNIHLSDSSPAGLAYRLKVEQSEGRLKDGSIVTGEPVLRDSLNIHGLTLHEHRLF
jgi:hypothetical protein